MTNEAEFVADDHVDTASDAKGVFEIDERFGKKGEKRFGALLASHPLTKKVHDVTSDPDWQKKGIDFRWELEDRIVTVDVKTGRDYRGHVCLETLANIRTNKPGWFRTSVADYIACGFFSLDLWYVFNLKLLRAFLHDQQFELEKRKIPTRDRSRHVIYYGEIHYLPVATPGLFGEVLTTCVARFTPPGGDLVDVQTFRHRQNPAWGRGRVVSQSHDTFYVQFESRPHVIGLAKTTLKAGYFLHPETGEPFSKRTFRTRF